MANWLDYFKGTANKVKNSALYNALTGNKDDEEITFTPLQKAESTASNNAPLPNEGTAQSAPFGGEVAQSANEGVNNQQPAETKVQGLQLDNDGNIYKKDMPAEMSKWDKVMYNMGYKNQPQGDLTLYERLVGQQAKPTDSTSQAADGTFSITASENPRTGGLLNDINSGLYENYQNDFSPNNIGNNTLADGRQKGLGYHIGEGLGTFAKFLGDMAPAYIAGSDGLEAGIKAGGYKTADKLYRNALNDQGINTDDIKGYISDDVYKNVSSTAQKLAKQQLDYNIKNAKNKTDAQQQVWNAVNHGMLDTATASLYMQSLDDMFPDDAKISQSNETKKTNATVETMLNPDKYKKTTVMRYEGLPTHKTVDVNNTYTQRGGTGKKYGTGGAYVKMQAPNGKTYTIPSSSVNEMLAKGGKIIG